MNKIVLATDQTEIQVEDVTFENNCCTISSNTKVFLEIKNYQGELTFVVSDQVEASIVLLMDHSNVRFVYRIGGESHVTVSSFGKETSGEVSIFLEQKKASFDYYFSGVNQEEEKWKTVVSHLASDTRSQVQQHLVVLHASSILDVVGSVPKECPFCICNQDNRIMNLGDSECTILPKLLIDHYDVEANHSAYIGKFSKEALFYLQSRGLSESESYSLLMKSFLFGSMPLVEEEKNLFYQQIERMEV